MKKLLLILTATFLFACQDESPTPEPTLNFSNEFETDQAESEDSWTCLLPVEEQAQFPGGAKAWTSFLAEQFKARKTNTQLMITGRTFVSFIVQEDGSVTQPEIIRSAHPDWDKLILDVIKDSPKWIPGKQRGSEVKSRMTVAIMSVMFI